MVDSFSDPTYPMFSVFAFLGFSLVIIPLSWHLQAWNTGTCLYMVWAAVACLNYFVNSIIWHGNALNPTPVWCDISSRIIIGTAVAIPAASLCINRRLYKIASVSAVSISRAEKRRAVIEDLMIGMGIPVTEMILEYVVQGHRFDIYEDVGCYPAVVNTWISYILVACWPILIGLVSAVYCIMSLRAFSKRRAQFREMLSSSNPALTLDRYFRLMALATTELLCTTPLAVYSIYMNLTTEPIVPYRGWADLHFDFSRVDQIPAAFWRLDKKAAIGIELSRWFTVICAFIFFAFFGFASEARRHYSRWARSVVKHLPVGSPISFGTVRSRAKPFVTLPPNNSVLPIFIPRPSLAHVRASLSSLTVSAAPKFSEKAEEAHSPFSTSSTSPSCHSLETIPVVKSEEDYSECYGHAY